MIGGNSETEILKLKWWLKNFSNWGHKFCSRVSSVSVIFSAQFLTRDQLCLTRRLWYCWIRMDTTRRSLILMGKYGLSRGVACCTLAGTEVRYFMFGENNLITSAHTRSFSRKLNSGCCKRNMINNITSLGNKRTRNFVVEHIKDSVKHYQTSPWTTRAWEANN